MPEYRDKLLSAIESVLSDIRSLSEEELNLEIKENLYDERTNAIFYAWENEDQSCFDQIESLCGFQDIPYISEMKFEKNLLSYDTGVFFTSHDVKRFVTKDDLGYKNIIASDEYCFMAAA